MDSAMKIKSSLIFSYDDAYKAGLRAYREQDFSVKKKLLGKKANAGFKQAILYCEKKEYRQGYELGYTTDNPNQEVEASIPFKEGYNDGRSDYSQDIPHYFIEKARLKLYEEGHSDGYNDYWNSTIFCGSPRTTPADYLDGLEAGYLEAQDEDYWCGYSAGQKDFSKYHVRDENLDEYSSEYTDGYNAGFSASTCESLKLSLFEDYDLDDDSDDSDDSGESSGTGCSYKPSTVPNSPRNFVTYTDEEIRSNSTLDPERYNRMEKTEKGWKYYSKAGSPITKKVWDKEFLNKKY